MNYLSYIDNQTKIFIEDTEDMEGIRQIHISWYNTSNTNFSLNPTDELFHTCRKAS